MALTELQRRLKRLTDYRLGMFRRSVLRGDDLDYESDAEIALEAWAYAAPRTVGEHIAEVVAEGLQTQYDAAYASAMADANDAHARQLEMASRLLMDHEAERLYDALRRMRGDALRRGDLDEAERIGAQIEALLDRRRSDLAWSKQLYVEANDAVSDATHAAHAVVEAQWLLVAHTSEHAALAGIRRGI